MQIEFTSQKKCEAVIAQIDNLLLADFPHPSTEAALEKLRTHFEGQLLRIQRAVRAGNQQSIEQACTTLNQRIYAYLPVLGLLLRSTNVRNSFESYDALVEIARSLLGPNAKVILSSEWDFSPLTYPMSVQALPDFVLLGMPATESGNALLMPLAGHELGHSCWLVEDLENSLASGVQDAARDAIRRDWSQFQLVFPEHKQVQPTDQELKSNFFIVELIGGMSQMALSQLEEIFCDAVGVALFGDSYIHAFHYLLAPSLGGERPLHYPRMTYRAEFLQNFSGLDIVQCGYANFATEFSDIQPNLSSREVFASQISDRIARDMAASIYSDAQNIVRSRAFIHTPNPSECERILRCFEIGLPDSNPSSLADILNASWTYVRNAKDQFNERERRLFEWASELALKSMEVMEYRRRLDHA